MDSEINDLVQKMDFASILEPKGLSNTKINLNCCSARLKHRATSQGNVDSDSESTIDLKKLVIRNNKSETRQSCTYLDDKKSVPIIKINRSDLVTLSEKISHEFFVL